MEPDEIPVAYNWTTTVVEAGEEHNICWIIMDALPLKVYLGPSPNPFAIDDLVHIRITKEPKPDAQQDAVQSQ